MEWLCSKVLASHRGGPGLIPEPDPEQKTVHQSRNRNRSKSLVFHNTAP